MSRITLHLKKQFYSPTPSVRHRYEEEAHRLSFSRDWSNSDTVTHTRGRSSSERSMVPARPPPVILSTIPSTRSSGVQTPAHGVDPVPFSMDIGEIVSTRLRERQDLG